MEKTSLWFKPFPKLKNFVVKQENIVHLIEQKRFSEAIEASRELIQLSLEGLSYFQT